MRFFLTIIYTLFALTSGATNLALEEKISAVEYIEKWREEAIRQMALHKIPASITIAQGLLESGNGNSRLAIQGNNHFGIKCHSDWKGATIHEDDETSNECFRKYKNASESFEDHSLFLQKKRYESLFTLEITDYKGWAHGLKKCGYATNPKYPQLLINLIEQYNLADLDKEGLKLIKNGSTPSRNKRDSNAKKERNSSPQKDESRREIVISNNREIGVSENRIKFITAKDGDSIEAIANDLDMAPWQIKKYNDLQNNQQIQAGQVIYLQPKRNTSKINEYEVKSGDTMWSISQSTGIKLRKLYKKAVLEPGQEPKPGTVIQLK
jgi:LysM repeat protein